MHSSPVSAGYCMAGTCSGAAAQVFLLPPGTSLALDISRASFGSPTQSIPGRLLINQELVYLIFLNLDFKWGCFLFRSQMSRKRLPSCAGGRHNAWGAPCGWTRSLKAVRHVTFFLYTGRRTWLARWQGGQAQRRRASTQIRVTPLLIFLGVWCDLRGCWLILQLSAPRIFAFFSAN